MCCTLLSADGAETVQSLQSAVQSLQSVRVQSLPTKAAAFIFLRAIELKIEIC